MSLPGHLRYHVNVSVVGKSFLRWQRLKTERKFRRSDWWQHEHLNAPHHASGRLKELISRHYLKGQYANGHKKVAWVTSGAPVEFLTALGFHLHYPENHGAVCGIRRVSEEIEVKAEEYGWSQDICSYARTDFGSMISGITPVGKIPRPDLLVCCTNICQTVLYWYRALAHHFDVPLAIIDTPFTYAEHPTEHAVDFVTKQIEAAAEMAEKVAGKSLDDRKLQAVAQRSKDAVELWDQVLRRAQNRPAPITAFDEFIHMAPIVEMRGMAFTVDYYSTLLDELDQRVRDGVGALKNERKRIIWDNLPVWYRVRWLAERLAENGVAMVASTYTNAWGELAEHIDPSDPIGSGARVYLSAVINQSTAHKMRTMKRMVGEYGADGVILHSDRSCKPYSVGQMDQRERLSSDLGVAALLLEADHNDPRAFSEQQVETRLAAFMEVMDT